MSALYDLYAQNLRKESDVQEHLTTFVRTTEKIGATRVIELGVRTGVSTTAWLYALNGRGHLWSVDIGRPGHLLQALADVKHWTFIHGRDDDPEVLEALPKVVDIVFIDTSHTYEQTCLELQLYGPRVRKGGRIFLHDTQVRHPAKTTEAPYPVRRAMMEYVKAKGLRCVNKPNCNGLGIIEM